MNTCITLHCGYIVCALLCFCTAFTFGIIGITYLNVGNYEAIGWLFGCLIFVILTIVSFVASYNAFLTHLTKIKLYETKPYENKSDQYGSIN